MTGTAQDQKKAARIASQCRAFFPWYQQSNNPDKYELQAFKELKAETLPKLESYTDAGQLVADRQKFADRTLIMQIITRAERMRQTDPEAIRERKAYI